MARLQRQLDFRRLAIVEASMSLAGPLAAVVLAVVGLEAEALVGGLLVSAAVAALLSAWYARPARPRWLPAEMREIARFGMPAAGSSVLFAVQRNVDYVILAARLPAAQVGFYLRGFQLGSEYQSKISGSCCGSRSRCCHAAATSTRCGGSGRASSACTRRRCSRCCSA